MNIWNPKEDGYFIKKYKEFLIKKNILDVDIKNIIKDATDVVSKCINPKLDNKKERISSTNLVLGYIQSGKTTSMEAVACVARDNGFKLIIILSGHVSNLAEQTKDRVYESLDMYGWNRIDIGKGKADTEQANIKLKNIISYQDNPLYEEKEKPSLLLVAMKHHTTIQKITDIFENATANGIDLSKVPAIIIDDEADHYSMDTKKKINIDEAKTYETKTGDTIEIISKKFNENIDSLKKLNSDIKELEEDIELEPGKKIIIETPESTTHRKIKRLRQSLNLHTFLGYTATPMAQFLIETVNYLYPKSATILKPGSNYTGAQYYFKDKDNFKNHVIQIDDDLPKSEEKPNTLCEAIRFFVLGVACGMAAEEHINKKSRSMLIHPSVSRPIHDRWWNWTKSEVERYQKAFKSKALNIVKGSRVDISFSEIFNEFKKSYENLKTTENNIPNFDDKFIILISKSLDAILPNIMKFNAKGRSKMPEIKWGKDGEYARILVGGIGLERGYTIEGLTVSYIARETGDDDTVYQRARFFGYKKNIAGYIRVYLPLGLIDNFKDQADNEIIIREKIQEVLDKQGNLKIDLERAFPFHRSPTRRNIIRTQVNKYPLGGVIVDNKSHQLDIDSIKENQRIYEELIKCGPIKSASEITDHSYKKALKDIGVIENLSLNEIIEKYLKRINFFDENVNDYNVLFNLADWWNSKRKKNLEAAIMIIRDSGSERKIDDNEFNDQNSRIPIESGANQNRPGEAFLHYEFLTRPESKPWMPTENKNSPYGTPAGGKSLRRANTIATIQLYRFDIKSEQTNQIKIFNGMELKNIPYFRVYIPKILGTGFLAIDN